MNKAFAGFRRFKSYQGTPLYQLRELVVLLKENGGSMARSDLVAPMVERIRAEHPAKWSGCGERFTDEKIGTRVKNHIIFDARYVNLTSKAGDKEELTWLGERAADDFGEAITSAYLSADLSRNIAILLFVDDKPHKAESISRALDAVGNLGDVRKIIDPALRETGLVHYRGGSTYELDRECFAFEYLRTSAGNLIHGFQKCRELRFSRLRATYGGSLGQKDVESIPFMAAAIDLRRIIRKDPIRDIYGCDDNFDVCVQALANVDPSAFRTAAGDSPLHRGFLGRSSMAMIRMVRKPRINDSFTALNAIEKVKDDFGITLRVPITA